MITKKMSYMPGPLTLRNRIINGSMRINQRGFTSVTSTISYFLDRWYLSASGANLTLTQVNGASQGFQYALQVNGANSNTGFLIGQKIESTNIYDLAGTNVTLSCYLSSSNLTNITWSAYTPNSVDTFSSKTLVATGSFNINPILTQCITNFVIPISAQNGLSIEFSFGSLSAGNNVVLTGVQLEMGNTNYPIFEKLPIGLELQLCQRYFWALGGSAASITISGYCLLSGNIYAPIYFPVVMRTTPTQTLVGSFTFTNCTSLLVGGLNTFGCFLYVTGTLLGAALAQNTLGSYLFFNAEL